MNKSYRNVWCEATGTWVAASELAKGKIKSSKSADQRTPQLPSLTRMVAALGLTVATLSTGAAYASTCGDGTAPSGGTCALGVFTPTANDNLVGQTLVNGGNTVTLTGAATQIQTGTFGSVYISLPNLYASGKIISGAQYADPNNPASLYINTGVPSQNISAPDPITGGTTVIPVYNNSSIIDQYARGGATTNTNANGEQYINARLGTVETTGGTLNVNIGTMGAAPSSATNSIDMVAKQTDLFYANGTGTSPSQVTWNSQNQINFASVFAADSGNGMGTNTIGDLYSTYTGTFTAFDGSSRTVNGASDLKTYNSFLIAALQNGSLRPADYEAAFNKAFSTVGRNITFSNLVSPTDEAAQPIGSRSVIHALGANATGRVAAGAIMDLNVVTKDGRAPAGPIGTGLLADQGAKIINDGTISLLRAGADGGYAMYAQGGSVATNNGLINVNFQSVANPSLGGGGTDNTAISGNDAGTAIANTGVINLAGPGATGMAVNSGAQGANSGIINLGVTDMPSAIYGSGRPVQGAVVSSGSFANTGAIYLGRGPQSSVAGATGADTSNTATPLIGISAFGSSASASNAGTITIGTKTQGSTAILAQANAGPVVNSGNINVNGAAEALPAVNYGIDVRDATNVTNSGTVTLGGVNGVGIRLLGTTGPSAMTSTGTITVAGGADPMSGTRNYGVWAEGTKATATVNGALNLTGTGAIGAHARDGAVINVGANAVPNFISGTDQIGFFAHGAGSKINVAAQNLTVATDRSTMFRVAGGAAYTGSSSAGTLTINVNGQGARGVVATGAGTTLSTGTSVYNVNGVNGIAITDEGGATGTIDATATINLNAAGATAGLVDGQAHDLANANSGTPTATTLTNNALIASGTAGVTGFVAQNLGTLVNNGNVQLTGAGSTGVVIGAQGTVNNLATIRVANGTGALVQGATATLTNNGLIQADDGVAAIRLAGAGASVTLSGASQVKAAGTAAGVLLDTGAASLNANGTTITASGTGAGIENKAEVSAIKLTNVTINSGNGAGIRTATSIDPTSTATLNVAGTGTGIGFRNFNGSNATGDLNVGPGYDINVLASSNGGTGIDARTSGNVSTAGTIDVQGATGGAAVVAHDAASITNTGTLTSVSTVAPVIDGTGAGKVITNSGTVQARNNAAVAIQGSANADTVNLAGGAVTGVVNAGEGNDTFNWTAGTLDGGFYGQNGSDTALVSAPAYKGSQILDGGDDVSTADGWVEGGDV